VAIEGLRRIRAFKNVEDSARRREKAEDSA
jgi:hypothetical protein